MSESHQRLSVKDSSPQAYAAVLGLERFIHSQGLAPGLIHLVKIRASQLNGCAYCLSMHHHEARQDGEKQSRLDMLSAWREAAPLYSEQEQAALRLTEEVTLIGEHGVSDEVWAAVTDAFSEQEVVTLVMAIATINVWNRLAVTSHQTPDLHDD
ncbi:MAG: carboxymuconolactone decarboxylase family protein [Intrasporangium sp.]|uniref:carboxymuconolactone decarboxylase family protein n=1 Tax=Intrasporangium sp. TaxID=1925024 RepID=UPI002648AFD1|nr:carboxymuconolactone decarboxylase family protein [Intrasporangium sp.]MDN5795936.1 carboxymuconolactone decarboxylase family protein [Intrasporangium sp.]